MKTAHKIILTFYYECLSVYEIFLNGEKIVSLVFGGTFKYSSFCPGGMWGASHH